jgi:Asp-tRNA(Asn)/Glu-tRNA(Gln) amidotransferase A subunit family amidase
MILAVPEATSATATFLFTDTLVAPIGRNSRRPPRGAQIIGPLYEDDTALTFAELLAQVIDGYLPPPI